MLTGQNLIYFAPDKWDGLWRNRQQLMSVFARQNKVLYVEGIPVFSKTMANFRAGQLRLTDLRQPSLSQVTANLFTFRYPVWAVLNNRFLVDRMTKLVRQLSLRRALNKLQMSKPIVWFHRPSMVQLIDEIPPPSLVIYHVVDEYTAYRSQTPASQRRTQTLEREMMALADAVVVVSQKLYEAKSPFNPNTYLVPNGVDYQAYATALDTPNLPEGLRLIRRPRLGYSGNINDKLDLNMLKELAQAKPDWSLIFLGEVKISERVQATWRELKAMPNVYYLGAVDVSQVPYYLKSFDVGLIPYTQSHRSENISPLKLYDYLAAGLPVASVDIPAAREFSRYIHIANGPQDFVHAVQAALVDIAPECRQARRNIATQHTWEVRVEQLSSLIQTLLAAKTERGKML
jgi:glycosyltransferase involved in cell wall biosynthesis